MSRHPLFLFLLVTALTGLACSLTAPAAQKSAPTPAATLTLPAPSQTNLPPTPTQPPATATSAPPTPTPTLAPTPTSTATAPPPTPSSPAEVYQAVKAAWTKLASAGPWHASEKTYVGEAAFQDTEYDSVPPNFRKLTSLGGTVMAEQYFFNGTLYDKIQGVWTQKAVSGSPFVLPVAGYAEGISDQVPKTDGKVAGEEEVDGKPAIIYSFTTTLKQFGITNQFMLSVDEATGLPVKQVIDSKVTKLVQMFTYDASLSISLPDEAKNAKPGP